MPKRTLAIMTAVTLGVTGLLATAQDTSTPPPGPAAPAEAPGRPGTGPGNRPPRSPLEAALDANGDGIISAEEIANAPAALRQLDRDGDGKLTIAEYAPHRPPFAPDQHQAGFNAPQPRREPGPGGPDSGQGGFGGGPRRFPRAQGMRPEGPENERFGAGGFPGRPHPPMERPENFGGDRAPFPPRPDAFPEGPGRPPQAPGFGPEHFDRPGPGPRGFGNPELNFREEAGRPGGYSPEVRPFNGEPHRPNRPPGERELGLREDNRSAGFAPPHHPPGAPAGAADLPPEPAFHQPPPQD